MSFYQSSDREDNNEKPVWLDGLDEDLSSLQTALKNPPQSQPPQPQPAPMPFPILPTAFLDHLMQAEQYRHDVDLENEKLRNELSRKQLTEEAYSRTISFAHDCTCTQTRAGSWVPIINGVVENALFFYSEAPLIDDRYYIIQFSPGKGPILLEEDEFLNDKVLLMRLQEAGVEVTIRRSPHATATLIRQAIGRVLRRIPRKAYAGWEKMGDGGYHFSVFYPFSSHRNFEDLSPALLPPTSPAVTTLAIEKFWPAFEVILDPCLRWFLFSWTNTALLSSLLTLLGHEIPLGLYIFAPTTDVSAYLHRLLCWYGDQPLSLDSPPAVFAKGLLHRKDQPLLIDDASRSKHVTVNVEALDDALTTHHLPWKNGREIKRLPLQALPTVVSSAVSDLACSPSLITLDLSPDQFATNCYHASLNPMDLFQDYIMSLANYTSGHIPELQSALNAGQAEAWNTTDGTLTEPCVKMLGILCGIRRFLDGFFSEHGVSSVAPPTEDLTNLLLGLLRETSEKAELSTNFAEEFIFAARSILQHGQLAKLPLSKWMLLPKGVAVVYYDENSLYFTPKAIKHVCNRLSASRPVVLRALDAAGVIHGAPINSTTNMTRVQLKDKHGVRRSVSVYRMRRSAFDQLGDPLVFKEE